MSMRKQSGAALIVVLAVLVVTLMLGLSSMQASLIDERLAGNYRAQAQAQMAAERSLVARYSLLKEPIDTTLFDVAQGPEWEDSVLSESSTWVGCDDDDEFAEAFGDCQSVEGAYRLVSIGSGTGLGLRAGYYVIGKAALSNGSGAESLSVFAKLVDPFSISSALTVLGGIENIESNKWYPSSNNARVSNGGVSDISAVYYEGAPHSCESGSDPVQECYHGLSNNEVFEGDVVYGGYEADTSSSSKISELYGQVSDSVELVTEVSDLDFKKKQDDCTAENSQFAFVKSFVISGSEKFCGVVIVWGGVVDIPVDATINGNASVEGLMIAANFGENEDGSPDFSDIGTVNLAINGGGEKGSVYFDDYLVKNAFSKVGVDYGGFVYDSGSEVVKKIASWD